MYLDENVHACKIPPEQLCRLFCFFASVDPQNSCHFAFRRAVVIAFLELCCENPEALITAVDSREVTRQRPVPLSGPLLSAKLTELIADYLVPTHCNKYAGAYLGGLFTAPR